LAAGTANQDTSLNLWNPSTQPRIYGPELVRRFMIPCAEAEYLILYGTYRERLEESHYPFDRYQLNNAPAKPIMPIPIIPTMAAILL
jgi:hypothetical protein